MSAGRTTTARSWKVSLKGEFEKDVRVTGVLGVGVAMICESPTTHWKTTETVLSVSTSCGELVSRRKRVEMQRRKTMFLMQRMSRVGK